MIRPGILERRVAAELEYRMVDEGMNGLAYEPVVAGGKNALVLHYVKNMHLLKAGELVLVDAGGMDYFSYRSDISRTYPVSGTYTPAQMDLYRLVHSIQECIIRKCRQDLGLGISDLYRESVYLMYEGLLKLGFRINIKQVFEELYPHNIGHHLGLDLHDCQELSGSQKLVAGNVITVEPGIYVPDSALYPAKYRNIGIRLEDVVVVGYSWSENLTSGAMISMEEIEAVMCESTALSSIQ